MNNRKFRCPAIINPVKGKNIFEDDQAQEQPRIIYSREQLLAFKEVCPSKVRPCIKSTLEKTLLKYKENDQKMSAMSSESLGWVGIVFKFC